MLEKIYRAIDRVNKSKNLISQTGADLYVLDILDNKRNGYFVDIGANHIKNNSNTYLLEKEYGWEGLLVDPNIHGDTSLRNSKLCYDLMYDGSEVKFVEKNNLKTASLFLSDEKHSYDKIDNDADSDFVMKKTKTPKEILDEYKVPYNIDFVSLDVEGSELCILKNWDWENHLVMVWCVEHNHNPEIKKQLDDLMSSKDYLGFNFHWDTIYIHSSIPLFD